MTVQDKYRYTIRIPVTDDMVIAEKKLTKTGCHDESIDC